MAVAMPPTTVTTIDNAIATLVESLMSVAQDSLGAFLWHVATRVDLRAR